ncbi:MAG: hypothetical protein KC416_01145 [Myxococcales bacterium]|nr:hypothetical protein [Myxococcales bacterium]
MEPTSEEGERTSNHDRVWKLASLLGAVGSVGAFLLVLLLQRGFEGRVAYLMVGESIARVGYGLVLLPVAIYVTITTWLGLRGNLVTTREAYLSPGLWRVQHGARGAAALLAAGPLLVLLLGSMAGSDPAALYDRLRIDLGRPLVLLVVLAGLSATAFVIGQGVPAFHKIWTGRPARAPAPRLLGVAAGVLFWLLSVNVVGYYSTGRALVGGQGAPAVEGPKGVEGSEP